MSQLETIRNKVEHILCEDMSARDSDKVLYVKYLQKYHNVNNIEDILLSNVPAMESLSRVRRKIQEDGMYLASDEVYEGRLNKQVEYIDFARNN